MLGGEGVELALLRDLEAREDVLRHPGAGARADGVGRHPVLREREGGGGGEADDPALGRRVVRLPGRAAEEGLGGGVDDPAVDRSARRLGPLPPVHGREVGGVEVALEVDPDHRVPLLLRHREDHPVAQDARVVDQDVELAEGAHGQLHELARLLEVGHVTQVSDRPPARGTDLRGDLLRRGGRGLPEPSRPGWPKSLTTTLAPSRASSIASARPRPRPAPVTMADSPSSGSDIYRIPLRAGRGGGGQISMQVRRAVPVRIWSRASLISASCTRWVIRLSRSIRPARHKVMVRS